MISVLRVFSLVLVTGCLGLSACGGGGGSSGSASSNNVIRSSSQAVSSQSSIAGTSSSRSSNQISSLSSSSTAQPIIGSEITSEQFQTLAKKDGVWSISTDIDFVYSMNVEYLGKHYPSNMMIDYTNNTVKQQKISGLYLDTDLCDFDGVQRYFYNQLFPLNANILRVYGCKDHSLKHIYLSDTHIRLDMYCEPDKKYGSIDLTWLSDAVTMDFGSLTFSSNSHASLIDSSQVCGKLDFNATRTEYPQGRPGNDTPDQVDQAGGVQIAVRAPYGDDYLNLDFDLDGVTSPEDVTPGVYTFVSGIGTKGNFGVNVYSRVFGVGENDSPAYLQVKSGTLTIAHISLFSVQGSYSLVTNAGDQLSGSFSLNLDE